MLKCNIKKYDDLPGRIGFKDIDAMRAALIWNQSSIVKRLAVIEHLKRKLDDAVKQNNLNKKKSKGGKR